VHDPRRTAGRRRLRLLLVALAGCAGACAPSTAPEPATAGGGPTDDGPAAIRFEDIAADAGIDWVSIAGDPDKHHLLETTGTGVAAGDFDGDGDVDLAFATAQTTSDWLAGRRPRANALFRNDAGRFVDVAESAGVALRAWSHGVYFVDHDGDGDLDLFVTAWGPNVLYRNDGDGTFTDVTAAAGVAGPADAWSSSAAFGDLDGDGDLDLYVANYCAYDLADPPFGGSKVPWKGIEVYRGPMGFVGQHDRLYRNDGDGTFTDVSEEAGIHAPSPHYGLGVVLSDLDDDGDLDVYVANDSQPNFLWRNDGGLRFVEIGSVAGVATNEDAKEQAGMGTDAGDFDGDGFPDLVVTNFSHDWDTLYANRGSMTFLDATFQAGLRDTYLDLAWGVKFADLDDDGRTDLVIANGHIYPEVDGQPQLKTTFRQADRVYRNVGGGRFEDVSASAGPGIVEPDSTRGLVVVDIDRDGRSDLVTSRLDQRPEILRNVGGSGNAWVDIRLRDDLGRNRFGIGAKITVVAGARRWTHEMQPFGSYLSGGEAAVHVGLGDPGTAIDAVTVRWPDGAEETFTDVPVGRFVTLGRGRGRIAAEEPRR